MEIDMYSFSEDELETVWLVSVVINLVLHVVVYPLMVWQGPLQLIVYGWSVVWFVVAVLVTFLNPWKTFRIGLTLVTASGLFVLLEWLLG
jgi:hypothetical protein